METNWLRVQTPSPLPKGEVAPKARVRGHALSWDLLPLTRRFAPTSPRRGEVATATVVP
jgi:hypothetical protein